MTEESGDTRAAMVTRKVALNGQKVRGPLTSLR